MSITQDCILMIDKACADEVDKVEESSSISYRLGAIR